MDPRALDAKDRLRQACQQQQWRFCFIGGVAVQRWGQPRLTQDVDLTILTGLGDEERFVDAILDAYRHSRAEAAGDALT